MDEVWKDGDEHCNWVIIQDCGEPLRFQSGELVVYGGVADYECHMIEGDIAMTIAEYANTLGVNWRTLVE
jgi:hypothetical protein